MKALGPPPSPKAQLDQMRANISPRRGEYWVAIWSRLAAKEIALTADLERTAAIRIADVSIVGTVLPWLSDCRTGVSGSKAFCEQLELQKSDWIRLSQESKGLCVAGDFNQDLLIQGHYYGSQLGRTALRTALEQCKLKCITAGDDDPLGTYGRASIDHICIRGIATKEQQPSSIWPPPGELNNSLSDHYGVYADLVI